MRLSDELWKRVLRLKTQKEVNGERLSRLEIIRSLNVNEHTARYIHQVVNDLPIISKRGDEVNGHVKLTDKLSKKSSEVKEARKEIQRLTRRLEVYSDLSEQRLDVPRWAQPPVASKDKAIASVQISDVHADEIVRPETINGANKYNREICMNRLQTMFNNIIRLGRDYSAGVKIEGLVIHFNGDMVSGIIHDELKSTNEFPIILTVLDYAPVFAGGILQLLEFYKRIWVVFTPGNHGRFDKKVTHKYAVEDNWDYALYRLICLELRNEKNVKLFVSPAPDAYFPVYNTTYAQTHGNQFRGGSGWMGILGPAFRGDRKKRDRQSQLKQPYDVLVMAHWHQYYPLDRLIVNGSVVGYNEFASNNNLSYEKPRQAFWLTTPEHGITVRAPIRCTWKGEEDYHPGPVWRIA